MRARWRCQYSGRKYCPLRSLASGVTLFVRNSYDQQERIVESEFVYSDRTLHDTPYPTGGHIVGREPGRYRVSERIVLRQP